MITHDTLDALRAQDERARTLATTVFDRPLIVEAGAGTGKTTTLVARMIAWTLGPGWEAALRELDSEHAAPPDELVLARRVLDGVLAITFTEAATLDMGKKLAQALSELARGERPLGIEERALCAASLRPARARALLRALERPLVRTIHGWCQGLLAEHPLEAGLDPAFTIDVDQALMRATARELLDARFARTLGTAVDALDVRLVTHLKGVARIETALVSLAAKGVRAEDLDLDPLAPQRTRAGLDSTLAGAHALLENGGRTLATSKGKLDVAQETVAAIVATIALLERCADVSIAGLKQLCDALQSAWTDRAFDRLKTWSCGEFNATERKALGAQSAGLQSAAATVLPGIAYLFQLDPQVLDDGRRVLQPLLAELRRTLVARGIESFSDLVRDARDLLRKETWIAKRIAQRTRQILIDEFQDTDALQCDLVRAICASTDTPPGLFIVGDPKQSIYAWRNADLSAYEAFVAELEARGGERLRLSLNRRSTDAILAAVEHVIAPVMQEEPGVQPRFEPLVPAISRNGARPEFWMSSALDLDRATSSERASELEAALLAHELRARHTDGRNWSDSAILMRSTGNLETYLDALRRAGVPYQVEGDKNYYRRREIVDAAALVASVIDPTDHVALVTLLRSPMVGVPDAALSPLWARGFPELVTELADGTLANLAPVRACVARALRELPADVPGIERIAGWETSLDFALEALGRARASHAEDALDVFVEKLRTTFLIEATESARYLGAYRLANLQRFFQRLLLGLHESGGSAHALLRVLRTNIDEARDEADAPAQQAALDAVRVMTIHKAKGLDFKDVYLVSLQRGNANDRAPDAGFALFEGRAELALFGTSSAGWQGVRARRKAIEEAERVRTLYVAMTRARERLVLAGGFDPHAKRNGGAHAATHLGLLCASLPDDLAALAQAALARGETTLDAGALEIRLPSSAPEPSQPKPDVHVHLPELEHVAADAATLSRARRVAREHMTRPWCIETPSSVDEEPGAAALHALKGIDWTRALAPELAQARERLSSEHARAIWDRWVSGTSFARLCSVREHVLARDVPVIESSDAASIAVGFEAGEIDLVYVDSHDHANVLCCFDATTGAEPEAVARSIAAATRAFDRRRAALRTAFGFTDDVRCELWLLHTDRIHVLACRE